MTAAPGGRCLNGLGGGLHRQLSALLAEGASSKEIAKQLGLTTGTVRAHLHTIYGKLGVENRTQAAVLFLGR